MTSLTDSWAQDVVSDIRVPAISPPVCRHLLPVIEMQIRKIIQQAHKFQKRGKSRCLTVEDVNLALSLNGLEEIYGLCPPNTLGSSSSGQPANTSNIVNLLAFARQPIPKCPLLPELSLHWLAVDGYQPLIPENPSTATVTHPSDERGGDICDQPLSLPKEIQHYYYRTTGLILSCDRGTLPVVLNSLRTDMGLQDLVPYFSKFVYQQVRAGTRSLPLLRALIDTISALLGNKALRMEFHLQQLLPAVFTCIVASKLATFSDDHWSLRDSAAQVVASICRKYSELFPDFQARFCKTYVDALTLSMTAVKGKEGKDGREGKDGKEGREGSQKEKDKDNEKQTSSLATMYGGIVGLQALGHTVVKSLLLPRVQELLHRINVLDPIRVHRYDRNEKNEKGERSVLIKEREHAAEKCRTVLLHALGTYMVSRLRLPVVLKIEDSLRKDRSSVPKNSSGSSGVSKEGSSSSQQGPSGVAGVKRKRKDGKEGNDMDEVGPATGLEEALVPYYATASKELYYCRLFI